MNSKSPSYRGYRFPPEIISHAVWLYHRFCVSFRDVEDLLAQGASAIKCCYAAAGSGTRAGETGMRVPVSRNISTRDHK